MAKPLPSPPTRLSAGTFKSLISISEWPPCRTSSSRRRRAPVCSSTVRRACSRRAPSAPARWPADRGPCRHIPSAPTGTTGRARGPWPAAGRARRRAAWCRVPSPPGCIPHAPICGLFRGSPWLRPGFRNRSTSDGFLGSCSCWSGLRNGINLRFSSGNGKQSLKQQGASMSDLADLFPGYASEWINTSSGRIFARVGGKGPPLLLLHGFSSTHVMWHPVAPQLADRFTLIIADLPGYGWSDMPRSDDNHTPYTKRAMAKAMVEAMEQLGHVHFALAGHDRGGRVSYRLALDHPGRLSKLAVLDIAPTYDYWERMNRAYALKIYHWTFLAQPYPLPETLISGAGEFFLRFKMASQTRSKTLDAIDERALEHYIAPFRDPARVHAMCEDYRAGAYADYEIDKVDFDAGKKITIPMLALWGDAGVASAATTPLDTWKKWATNVSGAPVDSGHFLTEENPEVTAKLLREFFLAACVDADLST